MATSTTRFFSDTRPRRRGLTLLIATAVTAAITVPLLLAALDSRDDAEPVSAFGISIRLPDQGGVVGALNADLPVGNQATLELDDPDFVLASWALYPVEGAKIAEGETFDLPGEVNFELSSLSPGAYEIFVTATMRDGSTEKRAARFRVLP